MSGWRRLIGSVQGSIARHELAVRAAVLLRNQANCVVARALGGPPDLVSSGEASLLRHVAPRASCVIDVGANVGDWTALNVELMPRSHQCLLYEPSRIACSALKQRFHADPDIRIVCAAVGDEPGKMSFFEEPEAGKTASLVAGYSSPGAVERMVSVTTLDHEARQHSVNSIDMVKIDAEGFDYRVLRGASNLLRDHRIGIAQFEYNVQWADAGSTLAGALRLLVSFGYRNFLLSARGLLPVDYGRYGEYFGYSNYVAVAPSHLGIVQPLIQHEK